MTQFDRSAALERLASEEFDVLVIGGGITGAGVALESASRGLRTALIEKADFASGTSSRSSKLVHGGLRYLQHGELPLVYQALHERQRLLRNAPHLVHPLPFVVPVFRSKRQRTMSAALATGLWAYDLTGGFRIGRRHRALETGDVADLLPAIDSEKVAKGFLYYDARADDARLTLAVLRTAALRYDAVAANYLGATGLLHRSNGRVAGAVAADTQPGGTAGNKRPATMEIRARCVINATGVWVDDIQGMDKPGHSRTITPAKGIHITFPAAKLPVRNAAVLPVPNDARSIFVIPWEGGSHVYVGTTDTEWSGSVDDPACERSDVEYLIAAVNRFVRTELTPADVTASWAGVRPLLSRDDSTASGRSAKRTADLSRRHTVIVSEAGLVTVTGGKLTTYRRMAEDTLSCAVDLLRESPGGPGVLPPGTLRRSPTRRLRLIGAASLPALDELAKAGAASRLGIDENILHHLTGRYGTEAGRLLSLAGDDDALLEPIVEGLPYLRIEAKWAVSQEMACTMDDILTRRTRIALLDAKAAESAATSLAGVLGNAIRPEAPVMAEQAASPELPDEDVSAGGTPGGRQ